MLKWKAILFKGDKQTNGIVDDLSTFWFLAHAHVLLHYADMLMHYNQNS